MDGNFGLGVSVFRVRLGNSVDKGFDVAMLPDAADYPEDVLIDASGEPLIINIRSSGHDLILITPKVMAAEGQSLHRSSRTLGYFMRYTSRT